MRERRRASRQHLHERVRVLHLVGVLLRQRIRAGHSSALRGARVPGLRGVDVVVQAVQRGAD